MKTVNAVTILCLAFSTGAMAQDADKEDLREELKFGIRAGANVSNVWDESDNDFQANSKIGFVGGVSLSIPLGKYVGVQPAMIFSQKGFQDQGTFLGSNYTFTRTTNYLDIPVLFEFKPTPMLTIVAGPQYSFLMSKQDDFVSNSLSVSDFERYENDNIRKNTLGALVGFDINVKQLVISPRAGWDLQSNNGDGTASSLRYKNQWVQLGIGYTF